MDGFTGVLAVPLWAAEIQEAGSAALMIDNLGFCFTSTSGCNVDEIIWTLSKALADLAEGLGVPINVFHTSRRTSLGDRIADDLSKGKTDSVLTELPGSKDVTDRASKIGPSGAVQTVSSKRAVGHYFWYFSIPYRRC